MPLNCMKKPSSITFREVSRLTTLGTKVGTINEMDTMIEETITIKGIGNRERIIKLIKMVYKYIPKIDIGIEQYQATQVWRRWQ